MSETMSTPNGGPAPAPSGPAPSLLEAFIKLVLGVAALLLLERLTLSMPVTRDARSMWLISVPAWVKVVTGTCMIVCVALFIREARRVVGARYAAAPDVTRAVTALALLVCPAVGYGAYLPLVESFLPRYVAYYSGAWIVAAAIPLALVVLTIFRNLGAVSHRLAERRLAIGLPRAPRSPANPTCPACGNVVARSQKFCTRCGAALGRTEA